MGLTGKWILPLLGAVMLSGLALGLLPGYDDVNSLPPEEKRRIIRELLRAQKDIRRALLNVHYSLNDDEFEEDDDDDELWHGCWDKELAGYRSMVQEKMSGLTNGLKQTHDLMDEIETRIKPGHHGHYESGYGGSEYGDGYGGGYGYETGYGPKPRPPRPHRPETTSWRPTTESYAPDDDDDYYARNLHTSNRRHGRELNVDETVEKNVEHHEPVAAVEQPDIDPVVSDALDALFDDKE